MAGVELAGQPLDTGSRPPPRGTFDDTPIREPLLAELERARRYGRTFTLVLLDTAPLVVIGGGRILQRDQRLRRKGLHQLLRSTLRTSDVVRAGKRHLYLLLPECDRDQALLTLDRLRRLAPGLLPPVAVRIATFPEDGVTSGALMASLQRPVLLPTVAPGLREATEA